MRCLFSYFRYLQEILRRTHVHSCMPAAYNALQLTGVSRYMSSMSEAELATHFASIVFRFNVGRNSRIFFSTPVAPLKTLRPSTDTRIG